MRNPFSWKPRPDPFEGTLMADNQPDDSDWSKSKRGSVDIKLFNQVKTDIKAKSASNEIIAFWYGIGMTTFYLIKQSRSFKQYKILRRKTSKPNKYGN